MKAIEDYHSFIERQITDAPERGSIALQGLYNTHPAADIDRGGAETTQLE
jgi:hypothetical protein